MSRVSALQCDRCKAKSNAREDDMPKGWANVRMESRMGYSETDNVDLCEKCSTAVRDVIRGADVIIRGAGVAL